MFSFFCFRVFNKIRGSYYNWFRLNSTLMYRKKLEVLHFGSCDLKVGYNVVLSGLDKLHLGSGVQIGSGCFFRCEGGVKIGDNVIISRNVTLYSNSHNYEGDGLPFDNTYRNREVIIEKNVWIGMNVNISPGSVIREGAIIGIGSNVFGEIPKGAIYGSTTGKIIKYRDPEHYSLWE